MTTVKLLSMTQNPIDVMWTAARTCYSAKGPIEIWNEEERYPKLKGNDAITEEHYTEVQEKMWKLVKTVLDSGHSCYDESTEVLTSEGFKFWREITKDDLIATIEPITHKMHYEKPVRLVKSDYNGKMYLFDNKYINLCVTPNHRLYTSLINSTNDRKVENFNFYKCEDIVYKNKRSTNVEVALRPQKFKTFCQTTSTFWYNPLCLPENKLVAFNQLVGFFIGDGYAEGGNRLEFHIKKERKINYLRKIVEVLGWELRECKNNKYKVFANGIGNFARRNYYDEKCNKIIPTQLLTCSEDCISAFVDGLMNSDGSHYNKNSFTYITTSKQVADILQALVHIIQGHASVKVVNDKSMNENWKERLKLEICIPNSRSFVLINDSRHIQKDVSMVDYNGNIYCCEVSTGLLMVRRNNKICLCGNSIAEHVYFTFAIEGISRACSHQLVRHRAGIVFSQQSQRYVEIKEDISLLEGKNFPKETYKENTEIIKMLDKYFVWNHDNYTEFYALTQALYCYLYQVREGVAPEDARNVLPNCTKTNIVMSINLRELIHICNLRLCTRAQDEIRTLFGMIKLAVNRVDDRLAKLLVPTCEVNGFCKEHKCCGRKPKLEDIKPKPRQVFMSDNDEPSFLGRLDEHTM